jgi:hypothetical protein
MLSEIGGLLVQIQRGRSLPMEHLAPLLPCSRARQDVWWAGGTANEVRRISPDRALNRLLTVPTYSSNARLYAAVNLVYISFDMDTNGVSRIRSHSIEVLPISAPAAQCITSPISRSPIGPISPIEGVARIPIRTSTRTNLLPLATEWSACPDAATTGHELTFHEASDGCLARYHACVQFCAHSRERPPDECREKYHSSQ